MNININFQIIQVCIKKFRKEFQTCQENVKNLKERVAMLEMKLDDQKEQLNVSHRRSARFELKEKHFINNKNRLLHFRSMKVKNGSRVSKIQVDLRTSEPQKPRFSRYLN